MTDVFTPFWIMIMNTGIFLFENEEKKAAEYLQDRIREFNNAHSPQHRAIR